MIYAPIVTAKLNDIDPCPWLADVVARIADHPVVRLDELLPWKWKCPRSPGRLSSLPALAAAQVAPKTTQSAITPVSGASYGFGVWGSTVGVIVDRRICGYPKDSESCSGQVWFG
jgi:hypothetical protein